MSLPGSRLVDQWGPACAELGVEILGPLDVEVSPGVVIAADMLVPKFGCPNGMIVVTDFARVRAAQKAIGDAGFGFSTLSPSSGADPWTRSEVCDVLGDWGWNGPPEMKPAWVVDPPGEDDQGEHN